MFESIQPALLLDASELYMSDRGRDDLIRECLAAVVKWRWATGDMVFAASLKTPFLKERYRGTPKWLKAGMKPERGSVRHGMDADGRVRVTVTPSFDHARINERLGAWTYLIYRDHEIDAIEYQQTPGEFTRMRRYAYEGDCLVREHMFSIKVGSEGHYCWDAGRLTRVLHMGWGYDLTAGPPTKDTVRTGSPHEERFEYDATGRLERIVDQYLTMDGTPSIPIFIEYQRRKKRESVSTIAKEIERMLRDQIPAAVAKGDATYTRYVTEPGENAGQLPRTRWETVSAVVGKTPWTGPFYCLLLFYCGEDFPAGWPPVLVLKREAERQRIIDCGEDVIANLWSDEDTRNLRLTVDDEALDEACRRHCYFMEAQCPDDDPSTHPKRTYASAYTAIRNVARKLNEFDWSKIIEITPDFFVAALDDHWLTEPAQDIKAVIPKDKFKSLRQRGFI